MFRSIVVMVDRASAEADACVAEAAELAERSGARLTLFAAVPRVRGLSATLWATPVIPPETPRSLEQACERECEALLRRAAGFVAATVPTTMRVGRGRALAPLLREVRERHHDLVVMDTGRSRGLRLAHRRFLRRCPAPVRFLPRPASDGALAQRPLAEPARAGASTAATGAEGLIAAAARKRRRGARGSRIAGV